MKTKRRQATHTKCHFCGKRIVKRYSNGERPNYCHGSRRYECPTCCTVRHLGARW